MRFKTFVVVIVSFFFIGARAHLSAENRLRSGDLIFQLEGESGFSKAITDATAYDDSLKMIHVGIIEVTDTSVNVIEASPEQGVRIISLDYFLSHSPQKNGKPGVIVERLNLEWPIEETLKKAKSYLGEDYDWWYLPDNGKIYCSELVWESFRDSRGERIFKSIPMNFRRQDGTMPEFWLKQYERLGMDVPEGMPGTNPNELSKDPRLIEIKRYF